MAKKRKRQPSLNVIYRKLLELEKQHRLTLALIQLEHKMADQVQRLVRERETFQRMPSWPLVVEELEGHRLIRTNGGSLHATG